MFKSIAQFFNAFFAIASATERLAVSVDNLAQIGQAHTVSLKKETLSDLNVNDDELKLMSERNPKAPAQESK